MAVSQSVFQARDLSSSVIAGIALAQLRELVAGLLHLRSQPIDAAALFHAGAHLGAQRGEALAAAF